jgi:hypothetical protein
MNWIGGICVLAVIVLIVAVVTDLQMTSCQTGSLYSMVGLVGPDIDARMSAGPKPRALMFTPQSCSTILVPARRSRIVAS